MSPWKRVRRRQPQDQVHTTNQVTLPDFLIGSMRDFLVWAKGARRFGIWESMPATPLFWSKRFRANGVAARLPRHYVYLPPQISGLHVQTSPFKSIH